MYACIDLHINCIRFAQSGEVMKRFKGFQSFNFFYMPQCTSSYNCKVNIFEMSCSLNKTNKTKCCQYFKFKISKKEFLEEYF